MVLLFLSKHYFKAENLTFYWYDHSHNKWKERQKVTKTISCEYGTNATTEWCFLKIAVPN